MPLAIVILANSPTLISKKFLTAAQSHQILPT